MCTYITLASICGDVNTSVYVMLWYVMTCVGMEWNGMECYGIVCYDMI